ncbi:MAG: TMF family protein [Polyangiaceae bacterium]|jgi:hypothetical protein|nr:TMF family protein [Polyangiaceae bacterium]
MYDKYGKPVMTDQTIVKINPQDDTYCGDCWALVRNGDELGCSIFPRFESSRYGDKYNYPGWLEQDSPGRSGKYHRKKACKKSHSPPSRRRSDAMKCCADCHFGVEGDGDTVHCNWTGNKRVPRDGMCESYDGEHPDAEYWRKDNEGKDARIAELKAELEVKAATITALQQQLREKEAEVKRLTRLAHPDCCGNCEHLNDGTCGDWGDGMCEDYIRAALAEKE